MLVQVQYHIHVNKAVIASRIQLELKVPLLNHIK